MPLSSPFSEQNDECESNIIEFGGFVLDRGQRLLKRDGVPIRLAPKTFDLLVFLLERSNRVVKKEEIFEKVWNDSFVEDSNLVVHISSLRKALANGGDPSISIETFPKTGYRLNADVRGLPGAANRDAAIVPAEEIQRTISVPAGSKAKLYRYAWIWAAIAGLTVGGAGSAWYISKSGMRYNPVTKESYRGNPCPEGTRSAAPQVGRCEEAVGEFSNVSNPNGNWSYGFTPHNNNSRFVLFDYADQGKHPTSPESPVNAWRRVDEFHPMLSQNPTKMDVVIQGGVVLPPTMFELHPGPDGQRSTVRWTAPAKGTYRLQGQFRGINFSGYTNSDAAVVQNAEIAHFAAHILGFNFEESFDLTVAAEKGDTMDFSVGWGYKWYVGDSTGFSAAITTIGLEP